MDKVSPCCVISTAGRDAAATAIFRRNTFTPKNTHRQIMHTFGLYCIYRNQRWMDVIQCVGLVDLSKRMLAVC